MVLTASLAFFSLVVAKADATTYYVCSSCANASDSNSGTEETSPWRTIAKVDQVAFNPGDVVLLMGTFGVGEPEYEKGEHGEIRDSTLLPDSSGTLQDPITFASYGAGATLTWGIFLPPHRSWIKIEHLTINGISHGGATIHGIQGIASAAEGYDDNIALNETTVENVAEGIGAHSGRDSAWVISRNRIMNTGGTGIEVGNYEGPHEEHGATEFTIEDNRVERTGLAADALHENGHVHGIYVKASDSKVMSNVVTNYNGAGITVRFQNSVVEKNVIRHGYLGISFYQFGNVTGRTRWNANSISETTSAGIYISGENNLRESFVITNNRLSKSGGLYLSLSSTSGSYEVRGNKPCNVTPSRAPLEREANQRTGHGERGGGERTSRKLMARHC